MGEGSGRTFFYLALICLAFSGEGAVGLAGDKGEIDFARQIRPILSNRCFVCHGPDEGTREADLRLDTKRGSPGRPGRVPSGGSG